MLETPTDMIASAAALSNEAIADRLDGLFRQKAAVEGAIVVLLGEVGRRQAYRDEGATATEPWAAERFGVSIPTARALTRLGEKAWDIPHLVESMCAGNLSLDKLRAVAERGHAQPVTRNFVIGLRGARCDELADLARADAAAKPPPGRSEHDRRFVRFNDQFRTMTVQLPPTPSPRPGPVSRPGPATCLPMARRPRTSASATPSSS